LEFLILTASRSGEVRHAIWDEIDFAQRLWVIPASRTKTGRKHQVPLSDRAVEILRTLPTETGNDRVFISSVVGKGLGDRALLNVLQDDLGRDDVVVHGFRASFKTWCEEAQHVEQHVVEAALAHIKGDRVEAAYSRGDMLVKRAKLMTDWAEYCASKPAELIPLRAAAK
jgi:integrase